ncbi:MAG: hypothetical protein V7K71_33720 [Nostoc sp.]|uniref:hypothetical protein n=1 Tax=Nostoc sp. TaxID=1180 RepID=UPI002FF97052
MDINTQQIKTDVLVIGGGIAGTSIHFDLEQMRRREAACRQTSPALCHLDLKYQQFGFAWENLFLPVFSF